MINVWAQRTNRRESRFRLFIVFVLIGTFIFAVVGGRNRPREINPHIKAEPYAWPSGCTKKDYSEKDKIPYECLKNEYEINNWSKYHWTEYKDVRYYRVGNDALSASCSGWLGKPFDCQVNYGIVKNAFHQ